MVKRPPLLVVSLDMRDESKNEKSETIKFGDSRLLVLDKYSLISTGLDSPCVSNSTHDIFIVMSIQTPQPAWNSR